MLRSVALASLGELTRRAMTAARPARSRRSAKHSHRKRHFRLELEPLEERALMSATIFGSVWHDLIADGLRDAAAEPGVAAVTVYIDEDGSGAHNGSEPQTLTNGRGEFSFTGLAAGTYTIGVILPLGAALSFPQSSSTHTLQLGPTESKEAHFGIEAVPAEPLDSAVVTDPQAQQMPSVAVNPDDPNHVVMAYMDYGLKTNGFAGIRVAVSHDAGGSWTYSTVPLPAEFDQAAGNPVVRFDSQGRFFVSYMAATFKGQDSAGNPLVPGLIYDTSNARVDGATVNRRVFGMMANNGVFVVQGSDDGAGTVVWGTPTAVAAQVYAGTKVKFETLPDIAIDTKTTLTLEDGSQVNPMYMTWTRFYPAGQFPGRPTYKGGSDVMLAASTDGGKTWQTRLKTITRGGVPTQVTVILDPLVGGADGSTEGRGQSGGPSHISVGKEGDVYVSIFAGGRYPVFHSTDRGVTFTGIPSPFQVLGYPFGNELTIPEGVPVTFPVPTSTLFNNGFRTLSTRGIAADPARPGRVYAVESILIANMQGAFIDASEINFARSNDYGATWETLFTVGSHAGNRDEVPPQFVGRYRSTLNDDNGGRLLVFDDDLGDEVISGQALPQLTVDADGNIAVIWYDTRRDPNGHYLDVYGTTSTDGGVSFSANYRVSSQNFSANIGAPTDGSGNPYLGDLIGLAAAGGNIYAAWTGVQNNNQDIFFSRYGLAPLPYNDRFEPNDTRSTALDLGTVTGERIVPRLGMAPGDHDWFQIQPASGTLVISALAPLGGNSLRIELVDSQGAVVATGSAVRGAGSRVIGQSLSFEGQSNQTYFLHVEGGLVPNYALTMQSLTADLGVSVHGTVDGVLANEEEALYRLVAAVSGSLEFTFNGAQTFEVLAADGRTPLAAGASVSLPVHQGQVVFLKVAGADGAYQLEYTNLDQFQTPQTGNLLFPTGAAPGGLVAGNANGDGRADLVTASALSNDGIRVLLNDGQGLFQAAQQYAAGAGLSAQAIRNPVLTDVNNDGVLDIIVTNYASADVSVLLGRGDGTFAPQRRFDATLQPDAIVADDFNGDGKIDLAVLGRVSEASTLVILLGGGDGTFQPPRKISIPFEQGTYPVRSGDFNNDSHADLVVFGTNAAKYRVLLGRGDGSFDSLGDFAAGEGLFDGQVADVDGDHKLDLIVAGGKSGAIYVHLGNGDGTFRAPRAFATLVPGPGDNIGVMSLAIADFADAAGTAGIKDGRADLIVTVQSRLSAAPAQVMLLPGLGAGTFGPAQTVTTLQVAGQVVADDFDGDGLIDIAATDVGGVRVIYGTAPAIAANTTLETARDLGAVVNYLSQPFTIVPGASEAFFKFTVPVEASPLAGDQIVDFRGLFEFTDGGGLGMEVLDEEGNVLAAGEQLRLQAAQGAVLYVRIFGVGGDVQFPGEGDIFSIANVGGDTGTGVATLAINVLPQLVDVQAESLFPGVQGGPGGAVTSLVLTLQGSRLDRAAAENPDHYVVRWAGPDGQFGTTDDQVLSPLIAVYNAGANVEISSGRTFATAVKQTVTLLFDSALPEGVVEVQISPLVTTDTVQAAGATLGASQPVVDFIDGEVIEGSRWVFSIQLPEGWRANANLDAYTAGTSFLTGLHNDLGAMLDALLNELGDDASITDALTQQILARCLPAFQQFSVPYLIIWLDPVSIDIADPGGNRAVLDLQTNTVANNMNRTFFEVGGNVQLLVMAAASGTFTLNLGDVQPTARGGAVMLMPGQVQTVSLTESMRSGNHDFAFEMPTVPGAPTTPTGPTQTAALPAVPDSSSSAAGSQGPLGGAVQLLALAETAVLTSLIFDSTFVTFMHLEEDATDIQVIVAEALEITQHFLSALADSIGAETFAAAYGVAAEVLEAWGVTEVVAAVTAPVLRELTTATRAVADTLSDRLGGQFVVWLRGRMNGGQPAGVSAIVPAGPATNGPLQQEQQQEEQQPEQRQEQPDDEADDQPVRDEVLPGAGQADAISGLVAAAVFASGAFVGSLRLPERKRPADDRLAFLRDKTTRA